MINQLTGRIVVDGSGDASFAAIFSGIFGLVRINPVGSVNGSSEAALTVEHEEGDIETLTEAADASSALVLWDSSNDGWRITHYKSPMIINVSNASEGDVFMVRVVYTDDD